MNDGRDEQGNLLPDEQRLTRLGHFLRSLTLDELPELFNVLKGEMSLVSADQRWLHSGRKSRLLEDESIYQADVAMLRTGTLMKNGLLMSHRRRKSAKDQSGTCKAAV